MFKGKNLSKLSCDTRRILSEISEDVGLSENMQLNLLCSFIEEHGLEEQLEEYLEEYVSEQETSFNDDDDEESEDDEDNEEESFRTYDDVDSDEF